MRWAMKLFSILAATAVAAAIGAAITIPAGARTPGTDDAGASLASCLRAHGAEVPSGGFELKQWIAQRGSDASASAALAACDASAGAPAGLVACLKAKGLTPPAGIDQFKPWTLRQFGTEAGKAALESCGLHMTPDDGSAGPAGAAKGGGGCGPTGATAAAERS